MPHLPQSCGGDWQRSVRDANGQNADTSTKKAYSGSAYYSFSSAAHVFTGAQMSLILSNDVMAIKFVLGFESAAATDAFSKKRNLSV